MKVLKTVRAQDSRVTPSVLRKAVARGTVGRYLRQGTSVSSGQLRRALGHYLDCVENGQMLGILRRGRPIALLVPSATFERLMEEFLGMKK